jgi:ligand-binding sensor domain-containing protein
VQRSFSRQHLLYLKHCVLIAAVFFFSQLLCSQSVASPLDLSQQLKVNSFSTTDGLTQASVFDIVQDTEGYIWFATQDGLNRFDGENFSHYRTNAQNEYSLADNFVRNLFIDNQGTLWVGTQNGLSKYNNQLDNFTNYTYQAERANGLADNFIWDIYQDNTQQIWVSTELGLHKFDQQSNQFNRVRVRTPSNSASIDVKAVKTIFQDINNNYWFSSYEEGFYIFNSALSPNSVLLKKIRQALGPDTTLINQINFLTNKKEYWLATNNGVFVLDQDYQLTQQYPLLPSASASPSASVLQSPLDKVKANTNEATTPNLTKTNVRTLITADNEQAHIWLGTNNGLKSISLLEESAKHYDFIDVKQTSGNKIIYSTFIDSANTLWLGTYDGVFSMSMPANLVQKKVNTLVLYLAVISTPL